ncbi:MAG: helix-turn-helix domain-containing protein [Azoarcus sp.]|jgi:transcriptional regulator with XRE-family HTH domain|nr:helix-turn-helix domain-containing protein [Azoarcus sp.]
MSTLSKRIREARLHAGISQERLGIQIGIDPASASARMNRYEQGTRIPTPAIVERIGAELGLPAAYFYAVKDEEARLLRWFYRLTLEERAKMMQKVDSGNISD